MRRRVRGFILRVKWLASRRSSSRGFCSQKREEKKKSKKRREQRSGSNIVLAILFFLRLTANAFLCCFSSLSAYNRSRAFVLTYSLFTRWKWKRGEGILSLSSSYTCLGGGNSDLPCNKKSSEMIEKQQKERQLQLNWVELCLCLTSGAHLPTNWRRTMMLMMTVAQYNILTSHPIPNLLLFSRLANLRQRMSSLQKQADRWIDGERGVEKSIIQLF